MKLESLNAKRAVAAGSAAARRRVYGLMIACSMVIAPMGAVEATTHSPAHQSVGARARVFGETVKHDARVIGAAVKEGARRVGVAAKAIGHEIATAARRGAAETKAAVKGEKV